MLIRAVTRLGQFNRILFYGHSKYMYIAWGLKSYQHIFGYLMTFPAVLVEEDLRIFLTE